MWPFHRRTKYQQSQGLIGYFQLTKWWLETFTEQERSYIEATYKPLTIGISSHASTSELTQGHIEYTTGRAAQFLWGLASWFRKPTDRYLARNILAKAEEIARENVLDLHFIYQGMIEAYYRDRDNDPAAFDTAIQACKKQIDRASRAAQVFLVTYPEQPLPSHTGFKRLAIIREKEKNYPEAIRLAQLAKKQGWAGDWEKRMDRCRHKQAKQ